MGDKWNYGLFGEIKKFEDWAESFFVKADKPIERLAREDIVYRFMGVMSKAKEIVSEAAKILPSQHGVYEHDSRKFLDLVHEYHKRVVAFKDDTKYYKGMGLHQAPPHVQEQAYKDWKGDFLNTRDLDDKDSV